MKTITKLITGALLSGIAIGSIADSKLLACKLSESSYIVDARMYTIKSDYTPRAKVDINKSNDSVYATIAGKNVPCSLVDNKNYLLCENSEANFLLKLKTSSFKGWLIDDGEMVIFVGGCKVGR
ncbi:MAG: hypothetical protein ACJA0H_000418 [Francisellaceae bacterium]|jgi:hypothetical protein